jgi:hypothetical protein
MAVKLRVVLPEGWRQPGVKTLWGVIFKDGIAEDFPSKFPTIALSSFADMGATITQVSSTVREIDKMVAERESARALAEEDGKPSAARQKTKKRRL